MPEYQEGRRVFRAGGGVLQPPHVREQVPYRDQPREAKAFMEGWFDAMEEAHRGLPARRPERGCELEAER